MRIAAVVLHHRSWETVSQTLTALLGQDQPPVEVLLVDNDSADAPALARLQAAFPSVRVLALTVNDGYAAGMNAGVASLAEPADAVLFLTHECVLAPDALRLLASTLTVSPTVGAAGPLLALLDRRDRVWSAGGGLGRRTRRPFHLGYGDPVSAWQGSGPAEVAWLDGAALLVRTAAWEKVGGFDPSYFLYTEERDLAARLQDLGYAVVVQRAALAWQSTSLAPIYLQARNSLAFEVKRRSWRYAGVVAADQLLRSARAAASEGTRWEARLRLQGLRDALTGRMDRAAAAQRGPQPPASAR